MVTLRGEGVIRIGDAISRHRLSVPPAVSAAGSEFGRDIGAAFARRHAGYRQNPDELGAAHPAGQGVEK